MVPDAPLHHLSLRLGYSIDVEYAKLLRFLNGHACHRFRPIEALAASVQRFDPESLARYCDRRFRQ